MANRINWRVRLKSKQFWAGIIGSVGSLLMALAGLLGYDGAGLTGSDAVRALLDSLLCILTLLGVIADPTTKGIGDSSEALLYTQPK